MRMKSMVM